MQTLEKVARKPFAQPRARRLTYRAPFSVLAIWRIQATALRLQAPQRADFRPRKWENVPAVRDERKELRVRRDAISC